MKKLAELRDLNDKIAVCNAERGRSVMLISKGDASIIQSNLQLIAIDFCSFFGKLLKWTLLKKLRSISPTYSIGKDIRIWYRKRHLKGKNPCNAKMIIEMTLSRWCKLMTIVNDVNRGSVATALPQRCQMVAWKGDPMTWPEVKRHQTNPPAANMTQPPLDGRQFAKLTAKDANLQTAAPSVQFLIRFYLLLKFPKRIYGLEPLSTATENKLKLKKIQSHPDVIRIPDSGFSPFLR